MKSQAYFIEAITVNEASQVASTDVTYNPLLRELDEFVLTNAAIDDIYLRFDYGESQAIAPFTVYSDNFYNIELQVINLTGTLQIRILSGNTEVNNFDIIADGLYTLETTKLSSGTYSLQILSDHSDDNELINLRITLPQIKKRRFTSDKLFSVHRDLLDFTVTTVKKVAASVNLSRSKYHCYIYSDGALVEADYDDEAIIKTVYVFINKALYTDKSKIGCTDRYLILNRVEAYLNRTPGIMQDRFVWP